MHFILRAKPMNFSLERIASRLEIGAVSQHGREFAHCSPEDIPEQPRRGDELMLLVNLHCGAEDGCPIVDCLNTFPVLG